MFKVGDRVQIISIGSNFANNHVNEFGKISKPHHQYNASWVKLDSGIEGDDWDNELKLIEENNMNLKEKFVAAFLSEPEKSFRKTGITNGDGLLTEDGKTVFLSWLLKSNGEKFKTEVVDELLKEDKE